MPPPAPADLPAHLRATDRRLLRALAACARTPRPPVPAWTPPDPRLSPPPLAEILYALSAAQAPAARPADPAPGSGTRDLIAALARRQQLAAQAADRQFQARRDDFQAVLDSGDREKLLALLTDLPAELRQLDFIRTAAAAEAPGLPPELALLLWREYLLPWTRESQVAHLLEP
jgi:hypothetical protein